MSVHNRRSSFEVQKRLFLEQTGTEPICSKFAHQTEFKSRPQNSILQTQH